MPLCFIISIPVSGFLYFHMKMSNNIHCMYKNRIIYKKKGVGCLQQQNSSMRLTDRQSVPHTHDARMQTRVHRCTHTHTRRQTRVCFCRVLLEWSSSPVHLESWQRQQLRRMMINDEVEKQLLSHLDGVTNSESSRFAWILWPLLWWQSCLSRPPNNKQRPWTAKIHNALIEICTKKDKGL